MKTKCADCGRMIDMMVEPTSHEGGKVRCIECGVKAAAKIVAENVKPK